MKIKKLKLKKIYNARDLGGIKTENGQKIKSATLYRSSRLYKLPDCTLNALEALHIKNIVDMRMKNERDEKPDTLPKLANYFVCPLVCTATPGITYDKKVRKVMKDEGDRLIEKYKTPDNYMIEMYRNMVTDAPSVDALKRFFRLLAETNEPVLYHCSSGKDRVGVATAILLSLLGVSEKVIEEDYMASKKFCRGRFFVYKLGVFFGPMSFRFKKFLCCIMRTKKEYISSLIFYIEKTYGSTEKFAREKLGLTSEDLFNLKRKYLEGDIKI